MSPRLKLQSRDTGAAQAPGEKQAFAPDANPGDTNAAPVETPSVGNNRKILVVDDNPVVLKAFEQKLRASGFTVITQSDGGMVGSIVQEEKPELILLDVNLSSGGAVQWNAMSIMQWLHRFVPGTPAPIIIMTGDDTSTLSKKFIDAGAAAVFHKPLKYPELLEAIQRILN